MEAIVVALIAAVPATIIALATYKEARGAKKQATEANQAVNNRPPGDPTIYETVKQIAYDVGHLKVDVAELKDKVG